MTANGVLSVSLDPPLALVCVDKSRNTHGLISADGWFGISIIRKDQRDIAMYYVRDAADRKGDVDVPLEQRDEGPPVIAGALAAPVRSLTPGMGIGILIESFIVTVIGGMGSIPGAFLAALLMGLVRSIGSIGFPLFVDGAMFAIMALVLIFRPQGLLGQGEVK